MKKSFLLLLLAACLASQAQTIQVDGEQSGVWDADTVLVTGDVTVFDSLRVMPGTLVLFDGFFGITIGKNAFFEAQGSETDSIVFTVADTTGFYVYNSGEGGWNGFQIERSGHFLLNYCVLEYGKAADTMDRYGGALHIDLSDDVEIHNSAFRCNFAREQGGAIYGCNSAVTMSNCQLQGNQVYTGDNTFALYGGAIQFLKCDVVMTGMEFRANIGASCIGGALSLDSCSVLLDRSVFVDNIGINGGGLYLMRSQHKECKFSNLLFDNNFTGHFGGGFALLDVSPEISNVLVINNESYGVSCNGIFFYGNSSPILRNCIVYGNYPSPESFYMDTTEMWIWTYEGYGPQFYNCLIEGNTSYIHSEYGITVFENIIDADPMFVDAANHDFRLAQGSPCIDAGDPATPQYVLDGVDLDGNPRVANQRIDIGPFEYATTSVLQQVSAPFAKLIGNPLDARSHIEFDHAMGDLVVSVYALTGRCTLRKEFDLEGSKSLELGGLVESLASGVYLIEVKDKDGICVMKAVK